MKAFRSSLIVRVLPIVCVVLVLKICVHYAGWEVLTVNPLFSGIIAANVFLMGFLISGVLTDYKESEKLPTELACSLETIRDEIQIIYKNKKAKPAEQGLEYIKELTAAIHGWFYRKHRTYEIQDMIHDLNDYFLAFEPLTQANFIVRMKQEQSALRRAIARIDTIRDTSFVGSAYAIAEATTVLVTAGLVLTQLEHFHEALFFTFVISFLLIYLVSLIKRLDNPFDHYAVAASENVSLKPLEDLLVDLKSKSPESEATQIPLTT